jgi:hypothetical protein
VVLFWSYAAPYFWPVVSAYLLTGIYYVIRDASVKIDRPAYLSNPLAVGCVFVFWFLMLIIFFWKKWKRNSRHSFFKVLLKQLLPLLGIFLILSVDFIYLSTVMR